MLPETEAVQNTAEERVAILEYLLQSPAHYGMDLPELLYYAVLWRNKAVADVLINHGVSLGDKQISRLTVSERSWHRDELNDNIQRMNAADLVYMLHTYGALLEKTSQKIVLTHGMVERKQGGVKAISELLLDTEVLKAILETADTRGIKKVSVMEYFAEQESIPSLEMVAAAGWLNANPQKEKLMQYATKNQKSSVLAWMLDYNAKTTDPVKEQAKEAAKMRRALSVTTTPTAELKKLWNYEKQEDGTLRITGYKGKEKAIHVPAQIGKDRITVIGEMAFDPYAPRIRNGYERCQIERIYNKEKTILVSYPGRKEGKLVLSKTFQKFHFGALDKARGITAFCVDSDNGTLCTFNGILYSKDKKMLLACPGGMSGTATLAAETESINFRALEGCPHVTAYMVPPENAYFASIDGVLYNKTADCLVKYPEGRDGEFVVPDCVHSCDEYAFQRAYKLTKITIPASVQKLSGDAFRAAVNLKELIMPSAIYDRQARNGASLEWVELTGAGRYFSQDGVIFFRWNNGAVELDTCPRGRSTPYTVPDGIGEIAEIAFQGCKKLPEIYFAGKIPKMAQYGFLDCNSLQIPKQYLRTADKLPVAFAIKEKSFDQTDFQWIAIHQTAKLWKEAVERFVVALNKAEFFQGMLDIMTDLKKIPKATGINVLEFVQTWHTELKSQQIRTLREILISKKCSAAVEAMDADSRLQAALSGEESAQAKIYDDPIEQLIRDNWISSKLVEKTQRLVTTGIAYRGSEKLCHPDVLTFILAAYAEQVDGAVTFYSEYKSSFVRAVKHPVADQAAAALDQDTFLDFLESLAKDDKNLTSGYLIALGRYATPAKITKLISQMREWENWGYGPNSRKAIIIARGGLMLSDTREAILAVDKVGGLDYYAALRGTTAEDLRDTVLSDFGLDEDGKKMCDLGNGRRMEIRLNADLSLDVFDLTTNKAVKSIPKKGADPERHAQINAAFSDMKKNAKKIAKARNDRLFQAFLDAAEFPAASWKNAYLKNPLLRQVASLLVWEQDGVTFTILNRGIITHDEKPMTLTDAPIRLAHPMEMDAHSVTSWQKYFNTKGLKQMFPQIWEPVFDPASIHKDRYDGCMVPVLTMSKQKKHGIGVDGLGAYSEDFELWLTDCDIQAEPSDWRYVPGVNDDFFFTLSNFTFKKYTRWTNHIVGWFDRYLIIDKIKNDDTSVHNILSGFTLAQITEFINLASENNCANVTAILLDYKDQNFADFDPMEEFSLDL